MINDRVNVGVLSASVESAVVAVSTAGARSAVAVGQATTESVFRIASLAKPLTAAATTLAMGARGVDLNTAVADLLPTLRSDWRANRDLTLGEVLSQTSGLRAAVTGQQVADLGDGDDAIVGAARLVVRAGNSRRPGSEWEYYNGNYFLAGAVLEALTGTTYESAMSRLLLRPWGLTATSFVAPDGLTPGIEYGSPVPSATYPRGRRPSGGLCSSAADLLSFGEHLLASADLLAQVGRARTTPDDPMRYGLGWAIGPSEQLYLNGRLPGYRTALMLVPEHELVAVVLAANTNALPTAARVLSDIQIGLTGDDLTDVIVDFAA